MRKFFTRISNQAPASKTAVKLDAVGQAVARSLQSYNEFGWRQRLFVAELSVSFNRCIHFL
ncbi:MAG: hypothetical protein DMF71_16000 [Acidobacteria bacterium]|nr:MAG: hypothetical protein DMF71_16000 [Acidobacteriota bacterium]